MMPTNCDFFSPDEMVSAEAQADHGTQPGTQPGAQLGAQPSVIFSLIVIEHCPRAPGTMY